MEVLGWIWTGLCSVFVVVLFFALPAWETGGYISGGALFAGLAFLTALAWILGIGLIFAASLMADAIRNRRAR